MKKLFSMLLCGVMIVGFSACENKEPDKDSSSGNHEYVDLGLTSGTLWATCNIGATKPEKAGDFFAWGETKPKSTYSESNYKWGTYNPEDELNLGMTKYNETDGKLTLDAEDDAATVNWGSDWRMPTILDFYELHMECDWTWTTDYNGTGVKGYIISSKAEGNTNAIFLPIVGYHADETGIYFADLCSCYWTSERDEVEPRQPDIAYFLIISEEATGLSCDYRSYGCSVRPVRNSK